MGKFLREKATLSFTVTCQAMQDCNSDSKQTTGRINLKPTRVTPAGLEVFEEVSTAYKFLVSEAPSRKNLKTKDSHIS